MKRAKVTQFQARDCELWNIKYDEELCIKVIGCVWEVIFK